jgi:hypothetical protein
MNSGFTGIVSLHLERQKHTSYNVYVMCVFYLVYY